MYLQGDLVKFRGKSGYRVYLIKEEENSVKYTIIEEESGRPYSFWVEDEDLTFVNED